MATTLPALPSPPADFGYTDEHELARQAARRFLTERCPMTLVRRLADSAEGWDAGLWRELVALGWTGLTAPEAHGGSALDELQLALLFEEQGRAALASPFFGHTLAQTALEAAGSDGQQAAWLPALASGERIATLALSEPGGGFEPGSVTTTATPSEGGYVLRGVKSHVEWATVADLLVIPARVGAGSGASTPAGDGGPIALFVVERATPGVTVTPEVCVDATRRTARVSLDGVRVTGAARVEGDGAAALAVVHARGAALLSSELVGGAEAVLGRLVSYAKERVQFDKPIGAFQAVKHPIVNVLMQVELSRSLALGAALGLGRSPGQQRADVAAGELGSSEMRAAVGDTAGTFAYAPEVVALCRMAKAHAGDTAGFAASRGVQLHGGYGFTWDCDVHFFFKRALVSRGTLGDGLHHRRHLAAMLLGPAAPTA